MIWSEHKNAHCMYAIAQYVAVPCMCIKKAKKLTDKTGYECRGVGAPTEHTHSLP